jgi:hypothetical protein
MCHPLWHNILLSPFVEYFHKRITEIESHRQTVSYTKSDVLSGLATIHPEQMIITTRRGRLVPHDSHGLHAKCVASAGASCRRFSEAGVVNSSNDSIVASFSCGFDNGFGGPGPEF